MYNARKLLALKRAIHHAAAAGFYSSAKDRLSQPLDWSVLPVMWRGVRW
jgi:hypothetical protein